MRVKLIDLIAGIARIQQLVIFLLLSNRYSCSRPQVQLPKHLIMVPNVYLFFSHDVNVSEKLNVLTLNSSESISMNLLALLKRRSQVLNIVLHRCAHLVVLIVQVCLPNFVLVSLLQNVNAMQTLDSLLKFLGVIYVGF